jgi:DNA-binding NarL/FixJ family response regulator
LLISHSNRPNQGSDVVVERPVGASLRVLLADDHALVRSGLRSLLKELTGVEVVGEASNGREALQMIGSLRPDIVIMDISMKELNGLEALTRASKDHPLVKIIILTMHADNDYVMRALELGAKGYLLKDSLTSELELAIRSVAQGQTYLSPRVSRDVLDSYVKGERSSPDELTSRQREILQLIMEGYSTKEMAAQLGLSPKTVEAHRAQILERLKIKDIPNLVLYAIRKGIVDPHT